MSKLRVLICGASVAGPTAAHWFAKAGATITIIERFPYLRTNGQNVDIRTVGVTVMRKMPGMEAAVRSKMTSMEGISFVNTRGEPYGTIRATGDPDQQSLVSEYEIFRGELAQILYNMTKDNENIKYVFGEQVVSMQQQENSDGPITVDFKNGYPTSDFDLVVACDGAASRTRAIGLGYDVKDYIKPMNCWAAYFSIQQDLVNENNIGMSYSAVGGRFMGVGSLPSGGSQVAFMSIHPRNDPNAMLPFREASKQGNEAVRQFVAQRYKGAGWKCDEIIKEMMYAQDFYTSELVQVKLPSLYNGRFVLVGDAGYAGALGSGTALAIAGAYVLAGEVALHKDNIAAGLRAYEERMKPIVRDLQKVPPLMPGLLAPQSAWGIWLRNTVFAFICWTRILDFAQRFFAGSFAENDKYELPDYAWVN